MPREPARAVGDAERRGVLVIGLIEDHDDIGGNRLQQALDLILVEPGARRVVRVREEHHACLRPDCGQQRGGIVAKRLGVAGRAGRRHPRRGARGLDRTRVYGKRIARMHGLEARRKECLGEQHEDVVRPVAERDLLELETVPVREL